MPSAEAHVATDRASRYLTQLCSHLNHMGPGRAGHGGDPGNDHRAGPTRPTVEHVDHSDAYGSIRFTGGSCTLRATADLLTLRIDAEDDDSLRRLQDGLTTRLEKIGRRDQLMVTWQQTDTAPTPNPHTVRTPPQPAPIPPDKPRWRRGWRSTLGLVTLAALVIVGHAGVFGSLLAVSVVEKWGLGVVVVLIVVKVLVGGLHVLGGGFALRRGSTLLPHRWQMRHSPLRHMNRGRADPDQTTAATSHPEHA